MNEHYENCPYCKIPLIVYYSRWNGTCNCPNCKKDIEVDFDFIILEDEDEWDILTLKKKEEQNFGNDIFKCKINLE